MAWKEDSLMSWEARKYKDIIDTLTSNIDQLELNIKKGNTEKAMENISDIRSDIKDLKGTTTAKENTVKDFITEMNYTLEVE